MMINIYTACYGGYDNVIEPPLIPDVRYTFFTSSADFPRLQKYSTRWDMVIDDSHKGMHSRMVAKWYKLHSHELFPEETSCWIDANMEIKYNYLDLLKYMELGFAVHKHPSERDCLYQEAGFCKTMEKYRELPVMEQAEAYRKEGMPGHYGLWACGNLFREDNELVRSINEAWWEECVKWTYQDQISFPYVLWKSGECIDTITENQYSGRYFRILAHNRND
jgi:hypothetical protein